MEEVEVGVEVEEGVAITNMVTKSTMDTMEPILVIVRNGTADTPPENITWSSLMVVFKQCIIMSMDTRVMWPMSNIVVMDTIRKVTEDMGVVAGVEGVDTMDKQPFVKAYPTLVSKVNQPTTPSAVCDVQK